jgi:dTDP-glucose 4,6-dehydratase
MNSVGSWNETDQEYLLTHLSKFKTELEKKSVLIAGGTGFLGSVLVESLSFLDLKLNLNLKIHVVGRAEENFHKKFSRLQNFHSLKFHKLDLADSPTLTNHFDFVFHSAQAPTYNKGIESNFHELQRVLTSCLHIGQLTAKNRARLIYLSSGAYYGATHCPDDGFKETDLPLIDENQKRNLYCQSKIVCESLLTQLAEENDFGLQIARCFSFVGPQLPLDLPYAASTLFNQIQNGRNLELQGDGSPIRSYMHTADFAIWMIHLMFNPKPADLFNIGSNEPTSIKHLAQTLAGLTTKEAPKFERKANSSVGASSIYFPNTSKIQKELKVPNCLPLKQGLSRTLASAIQVT